MAQLQLAALPDTFQAEIQRVTSAFQEELLVVADEVTQAVNNDVLYAVEAAFVAAGFAPSLKVAWSPPNVGSYAVRPWEQGLPLVDLAKAKEMQRVAKGWRLCYGTGRYPHLWNTATTALLCFPQPTRKERMALATLLCKSHRPKHQTTDETEILIPVPSPHEHGLPVKNAMAVALKPKTEPLVAPSRCAFWSRSRHRCRAAAVSAFGGKALCQNHIVDAILK